MKLYICEKPSQGKSIASVVGATKKQDGFYEGDDIVVTWGVGHLLSLAEPHKYEPRIEKDWNIDYLPIVPKKFIRVPTPKTKKQLKVIGDLIKKADSIVISTDADREGEAIARTIMDHFKWDGKTERLWLSALDDISIKKALDNVLDGEKTEDLYQAALGRSQADWITGMNLTIAYTAKSNTQGVLSVGRVQTPTLNLIVSRDSEIENFKSKDYYVLKGQFTENSLSFTATLKPNDKFTNEDNLIIDKNIIDAINKKVKGQDGQVTVYKTEGKKQSAPLPFDLSELQKELSKLYGIGAKDTLDIAQSLYETHKATTYPRTDCQYLPESQLSEVEAVISALSKNTDHLKELKEKADISIKSKVWNDKKITAHHAIIPTMQAADISKMSGDEAKAYTLIVERYLLQFFPSYEFDQTTIEITVNGQQFSATGKTPIIQGWKLGKKEEDEKECSEMQSLPALKEGDNLKCEDTIIEAKKTTPPKRYTEGTLIQGMKSIGKYITDPELKKILKETSGIGTEATRANIIETLFKRKYIEKEGLKNVVSTKLGRDLIDVLPDEVKNPATTAIWEQALDQVATGERTLADFMQKQNSWINSVIEDVRKSDKFVEEKPEQLCPECGKGMFIRNSVNGQFLACSGFPECKKTLPYGKPKKKSKRKAKKKSA